MLILLYLIYVIDATFIRSKIMKITKLKILCNKSFERIDRSAYIYGYINVIICNIDTKVIIMIFSNNACMNILHITKVIIIILQGRND